MYTNDERSRALRIASATGSLSEASRATGISRSTLRAWLRGSVGPVRSECPRCCEVDLDADAYAALLGYYLGDGCISRMARYYALRISCDAALPGIIDDVESCLAAVRPGGRIFDIRAAGCVVVQSHWMHWPCLFPQHGPGPKHLRPIVLEGWQRTAADQHPESLLRGLFHSDGCRVRNWTRKVIGGELKRYDYPRWQFTNVSMDIRELCCWALDLVEVPWRQSSWNTISVSTRAGVARLDELIGLKT